MQKRRPAGNWNVKDKQTGASLWKIIGKPACAAGVAVPLSALRSERGLGIGEIPDLKLLIDWCSAVGIRIIQLLPLNDTGTQTSPYSALSSMAMNPVYLGIQNIEGASKIKKKITLVRQKFNATERCLYGQVRRAKLELSREIFDNQRDTIVASERFRVFRQLNPWLRDYSVFCVLKVLHEGKWWREWPPDAREADEKYLLEICKTYAEDCLFYHYLQWKLEVQMTEIHDYARSAGVALKGDIPILISDDSADVWQNEQYFDTSLHAGAPPDMFSDEGQNWGMPIYNWEALEKDGFGWWIARLKQFEKFFDAVRIDHILGFFRIWSVPSTEKTARLGYFVRTQPITKRTLIGFGLVDKDIARLSEPSFPKKRIRHILERLPGKHQKKLFCKTETRGLYRFCPNIRGEIDFAPFCKTNADLFRELSVLWADRVLLRRRPGQSFSFRWNFPDVAAFQKLDPDIQRKINVYLAKYEKKQQKMWQKNALKLLNMILHNTKVLVCAEDLGYVPQIVPSVLKQLGIFSLKVERWTKNYDTCPSTFIPPGSYPVSSVCTPSVHDSSTLRGWWEEKRAETEQYYRELEPNTPAPPYLTTEIAKQILQRNLGARSVFTIMLLQDYFSLTYEMRTYHPAEERINVPGTISTENWSWRMKMTLEDLTHAQAEAFNIQLRGLIKSSGRLGKRGSKKSRPV